jgi:hypothetical protein
MEPTWFEVVFWGILGIGGMIMLLLGAVLNPYYDPDGDDPYRYCPKE